MKVKVYSSDGKTKNMDISSEIFDITGSPKLLAQAVQRQLGNLHRSTAHTKTRGEVRGGGRKPFRQKGTGRARAGSIRSPLWIGGGVVFGPQNNRNYQKNIPKKMLRRAILTALSEKVKTNRLIVVSELKLEKIATKSVQDFLEKLPIEEGKILIVLAKTNVNWELSAANLPYAKTIQIQNISLLDLLKYNFLLTDQEGIKAIEKVFGGNG